MHNSWRIISRIIILGSLWRLSWNLDRQKTGIGIINYLYGYASLKVHWKGETRLVPRGLGKAVKNRWMLFISRWGPLLKNERLRIHKLRKKKSLVSSPRVKLIPLQLWRFRRKNIWFPDNTCDTEAKTILRKWNSDNIDPEIVSSAAEQGHQLVFTPPHFSDFRRLSYFNEGIRKIVTQIIAEKE